MAYRLPQPNVPRQPKHLPQVALAVCIALLTVVAMLYSSSPPAMALAERFTVSGTVTTTTGSIHPDSDAYLRLHPMSAQTGLSLTTDPNDDGSFEFPDVPAGDYTLEFVDFNLVYKDIAATPHGYGNTITVSQDTDASFAVEMTGAISGTILYAEGGDPTVNSYVLTVYKDGETKTVAPITMYPWGEKGNTFTAWGLETGKYRVEARDWYRLYWPGFHGGAQTWEEATSVEVVAGQVTTGVDIILHSSQALTAHVIDENGDEFDHLTVEAYSVNTTDSSYGYAGGWEFPTVGPLVLRNVPDGQYRIRISSLDCSIRPTFFGGADFATAQTVTFTRNHLVDLGTIQVPRSRSGKCFPSTASAPRLDVVGTTVTASWDAPANDGVSLSIPGQPDHEYPDVSGYSIESSPPGATCRTNGARTCEVTGMRPGVTYWLYVVAENEAGQSSRSLPSQPVQIAAIPEAPTSPATGSHADAIAQDNSKTQKAPNIGNRARKGKVKKLPTLSDAGTRLRWRSTTPRRCTIRNGSLVTLRHGTCRLTVVARAPHGWSRLKQTVAVQIR